ncbi:MAG: HD domain-containing phosphohydrolase [Betaproteobacteria bacterium]
MGFADSTDVWAPDEWTPSECLERATALLREADGRADDKAVRARNRARTALRLAYRRTDDEAVAKAMLDLSKQLAWEGRVLDAIELAMFGGTLLRETLGECEASARSLLQHGVMLTRASNWGDAAKLFMQAEEMAVRLANPMVRSMALSNLGGIFLELGRNNKAVDLFKEAYALAETAVTAGRKDAAYYLGGHAANITHAHRFRNGLRSSPEAIEDAYRAIALLERVEGPTAFQALSQVHATTAEFMLYADRLDEAAGHAAKAQEFARKEGSRLTLTRAEAMTGLIEVFRGQADIGLTRIERVVDECRKSIPTSLQFMLLTLFDARRRAGDLAGARKAQAEYMQHRRRSYRTTEAAQIADVTKGRFAQDESLESTLDASDRELRAELLASAYSVNNLLWLAIGAEAPSDPDGLHIFRVGGLAGLIGERLRLDPETCSRLRIAGCLHDIGMIDVPATTQQSAKRFPDLSPEERESINKHPERGAEYVRGSSPWALMAQQVIRHHHERYDGAGYPQRLVGKAIPLVARIVAVADAFDAMTHERPRAPRMSVADAIAELQHNAGRQFDPQGAAEAAVLLRGLGDTVEAIEPHLLAWTEQVEAAREARRMMQRSRQH